MKKELNYISTLAPQQTHPLPHHHSEGVQVGKVGSQASTSLWPLSFPICFGSTINKPMILGTFSVNSVIHQVELVTVWLSSRLHTIEISHRVFPVFLLSSILHHVFVYTGREWASFRNWQAESLLGSLDTCSWLHSAMKEKKRKWLLLYLPAVRLCACFCLTREKRSFCRPSRSTGCRLRSLMPGSRLSSMDELYWIR